MKKILIKNGIVVNANKQSIMDVLIERETIKAIDNNINIDFVDKIIDASGCFVMPGGIDAHVHFDLPTPAGNSSDNFYTGSLAAIAGGTTSVIDFVTPEKKQSFVEALEDRINVASNSIVDYGLHLGVTHWSDKSKTEIFECIDKYGVTSFKTYLAYKGTVGIEDIDLINLMDTVGPTGSIVTIHCEHGDVIKKLQQKFVSEKKLSPLYHALSHPAEIETEAINRSIVIAEQMNCPIYIVHVSSGNSIELIRQAKQLGKRVLAETCPHYLFLDDSKYYLDGFNSGAYVISPPLRKKYDQELIWNGIIDGTISVIATDHCPFNLVGQKDKGICDFTKIPNGAGGVEHRLSLMYTYGIEKNRIDLQKFVALNSTNPAKIFGLYPQKGLIEIGSDADIVIWNPTTEHIISKKNHHQRCDTNIYEGFPTTGSPKYVFIRGNLVYENGNFNTTKIKGKYLHRTTGLY